MRAGGIQQLMRWHDISLDEITKMRELWLKGRDVVMVARWMNEMSFSEAKMVAGLKIAFLLPASAAHPIGGWSPDGTGEVTDERLRMLVNEPIAVNTFHWISGVSGD